MARYLAAAIAAALMAVFVYPATALGAKPEKVEVCHIGENGPKTLTVPEKVAQNHVEKHGDSLGACATGPGPAAGCYATETGGADLDYDGNVNTPSNTKLFAGGTNCPAPLPIGPQSRTLVLANSAVEAASVCSGLGEPVVAPINLASLEYEIQDDAWLCFGG